MIRFTPTSDADAHQVQREIEIGLKFSRWAGSAVGFLKKGARLLWWCTPTHRMLSSVTDVAYTQVSDSDQRSVHKLIDLLAPITDSPFSPFSVWRGVTSCPAGPAGVQGPNEEHESQCSGAS